MKKIYLKIKFAKGKSANGYILDISRGGIGIACSEMIRKNTAIEIMPKNNIFWPMQGKVVSTFCRKKKGYSYRLGVKFISTQKQKRVKLDSFIRKIEKRRAARLPVI